MKRLPLFFGIFLSAMIGCGFGCLVAMKVMQCDLESPEIRGHDLLHHELGIDEDQTPGLEKLEHVFGAKEAEARSKLTLATEELGRIIVEERSFSPRVEEAVERVHHQMAELQKLTLHHIFEMETVLSPEQYQRLLDLAGASLGE
tara:strand:- start:326 stop:760 length:435 start_codon:yes stop_codon:yes gene_type:complete